MEPWGGDGVLDPGQCTSWRPRAGHCFLDSACTLARLLLVGERAEMWPQAEPTDQPDALGKGGFLDWQLLATECPSPDSLPVPLQVWNDKRMRRKPVGTLSSMGQTPLMA